MNAEYRALLRMRRASRERYDDEAFQRFSRLLLKVGGVGVGGGWTARRVGRVDGA